MPALVDSIATIPTRKGYAKGIRRAIFPRQINKNKLQAYQTAPTKQNPLPSSTSTLLTPYSFLPNQHPSWHVFQTCSWQALCLWQESFSCLSFPTHLQLASL